MFPLNSKKPRKGDATAEEMSKAGAGAEYAEPELFTVATLLGNSKKVHAIWDINQFLRLFPTEIITGDKMIIIEKERITIALYDF